VRGDGVIPNRTPPRCGYSAGCTTSFPGREGRGQGGCRARGPGLLETLLNQKRDDINRLEKLCGGKVAFHADPALAASSFSIDNGTAK